MSPTAKNETKHLKCHYAVLAAHGGKYLRRRGLPLDEVAWCRLRTEHMQALVIHMLDSGYSTHTCSKYLSALRGVLTESCPMCSLSVSELLKIQKIQTCDLSPPPRNPFIEQGALGELLSMCASDWRFHGIRDSAMIALLYGCGFDRNEVAAVN